MRSEHRSGAPRQESAAKLVATTATHSVTASADNDTEQTSTAVYGAGHINKRYRSTKVEMDARYDAIYEIAKASQPTGVRFIYYRATVLGIVPKTDSGYVKVQRAVLDMRRLGVMPWSWIVDSNRWMRKPQTWGSVEDMLTAAAASYRKSLWTNSPVAVEVWCESESVAGVLYPTTSRWDVPLYPIKGQTSDSFAYGAAQSYKRDPRRLVVFYVGDHDPAGYEIETNLNAKLVEHSGRTDIEFTRLACDADDVVRLELPGTRAKKTSYKNAMTDERVPWVGPAVEIEAIDPVTLRTWLDDWISQHVDPDVLRLNEIAEQSERDVLTAMAGGAR